MGLISSNIPNLVGGVSQQPAAIRRENQFEAQLNAYSSLVEGLGPRRPSYHVRKLIDSAVGQGGFWHFITRDLEERYVATIVGGVLRVYDLDGNEKTVTFPDGTGYLTSALPRETFKAITVADYTFVVNTSVEVEMAPDLTPTTNPEALVYVKQGNYGKTYAVYVNGATSATYSTPDGGSASHSTSISTDHIAEQLRAGLAGSLSGWTITRYGSTIHISAPGTTDFTLATHDGYSGLALIPIKDTVQRFTDLPRTGPEGFTIAVSGDQGVEGDVYYLKYTNVYDGANSGGQWKETHKKGIEYKLATDTMPHQLIRNADGTFTFQEATWVNRMVGDLDTNPNPSFVGKTINDVFFSRNRLGFAAGENVINSRSGEFFAFFRRTTTVLLDDDPVDTSVSSVRVSTINWATPFNKSLVLFSERGQHELGSADVLTPRTAAVVPTSEYESSPRCRPATTGTSVFFPVEQDGFTQVREYYDNGQVASRVAAYNTTEQCPRYIPAGVFKLTASRSEDVVAALTTADPSAIFVYRYFGSPDDRAQSAWTRWDMGGTVLAAEFIKADLWLVVERNSKVFLEYVPLAAGKKDDGAPYLTHLDRRVTEAGLTMVYNASLEVTSVTLPYPASGASCVVRADSGYTGDLRAGQTIEVVSTSGNDIVLEGDHRHTPMIFGFTYMTEIELSKIFPRERRSQASKTTIVDGRLQLKYLTLLVGDTSSFRVTVQPQGRPVTTKTFNGRVVGSSSSIIGEVPLYSGKVRVPVLGRGDSTVIKIIHDSHLPMNVLAMEWEGMFHIRSQRSE